MNRRTILAWVVVAFCAFGGIAWRQATRPTYTYAMFPHELAGVVVARMDVHSGDVHYRLGTAELQWLIAHEKDTTKKSKLQAMSGWVTLDVMESAMGVATSPDYRSIESELREVRREVERLRAVFERAN